MNATTTSLFVKIVPPDGNPAIAQYQASVKLGSAPQTCSVKAEADPLGCKIGNLTPAKKFTIQVKGCLPASAGCGNFKEKPMWTKPNRTFALKITVGFTHQGCPLDATLNFPAKKTYPCFGDALLRIP